MAVGLDPDKAEDEYSEFYWGVAVFDRSHLEWYLEPINRVTKQSAEFYRDTREAGGALARVVRVKTTISYHEVEEDE